MAMNAGKLVGDTRRANAEDARQEAASKADLALKSEQTRNAKTTADANTMDYARALQEKTLRDSLMSTSQARDSAMQGTETPDGRAVDFQAVKKANRGFEQSDANLWNFLNPGNPMSAEQLKGKRARDEGDAVLASEEKANKAQRDAETQKSDMATAEAQRAEIRKRTALMSSKSDKPVQWHDRVDDQGYIIQTNPVTGEVRNTGVKAQAKPGSITNDPKALADQAQSGIDIIDQMIGNEKAGIKPHPGFTSAVGQKGASSLFGLRKEPFAGTDAADFMSLYNQVGGQAFLDARQRLKGGGAITDFEGQKAQQAITRMQTSQSESEFKKAAEEYRGILQAAKDRADRMAASAPGGQSGAGGMGNSGGPPQISTDAEFDALPSGAVFIDPQGNRRRKP